MTIHPLIRQPIQKTMLRNHPIQIPNPTTRKIGRKVTGQTLVEYLMLVSMAMGILVGLSYYYSKGFHEKLYDFYYDLISQSPPASN